MTAPALSVYLDLPIYLWLLMGLLGVAAFLVAWAAATLDNPTPVSRHRRPRVQTGPADVVVPAESRIEDDRVRWPGHHLERSESLVLNDEHLS